MRAKKTLWQSRSDHRKITDDLQQRIDDELDRLHFGVARLHSDQGGEAMLERMAIRRMIAAKSPPHAR